VTYAVTRAIGQACGLWFLVVLVLAYLDGAF